MTELTLFDQEIWLPAPGFEDAYEVSNLGNVRGIKRLAFTGKSIRVVPSKEITKHANELGYLLAALGRENKTKLVRIHRLVGIAFLANPFGKKEINHVDGNKKNNHWLNLEWCTRSENMKHAYRTGLKKSHYRNLFKGNCA